MWNVQFRLISSTIIWLFAIIDSLKLSMSFVVFEVNARFLRSSYRMTLRPLSINVHYFGTKKCFLITVHILQQLLNFIGLYLPVLKKFLNKVSVWIQHLNWRIFRVLKQINICNHLYKFDTMRRKDCIVSMISLRFTEIYTAISCQLQTNFSTHTNSYFFRLFINNIQI